MTSLPQLGQLGAVVMNDPPPVPPVEPTGRPDLVDKHLKNLTGGGQ